MYCKKCGYELKENGKFCPKCSEAVENRNEIINTENIKQTETVRIEQNQELSKSDGKDKIYLIVFLVSIACFFLIKQLSAIAFLVALIVGVAGIIKYPKNRVLKVLFWLFLVGIVLYIVFIFIIAYSFMKM